MSSHIVLPLSEKHVEPILKRKDEIVSRVESLLPPSKVQKGMRSFNEKLAEFRQLVHDCSFLNAELRDMSPLEQVFLGIGDVMRKENISVEYPRSRSPERPAKSTCLESVVQPVPSAAAQEKSEQSASEAKAANYILPPIGSEEFEEIPKYMRGRMSAAELNEETAATAGKLFCQEVDLKPMLSDRAKTLFRTAVPCLRHVHRIKEVRVKGQMSDEKYEIKRILAERKIDGKSDKMEYLVDWEPTWVYDTDMDARLLDDFHYSVVILGPINTPENLQKKSIKEMDLVVQRESKKENVKDGVILELMPYEQVKKLYPDELFEYIETTFSLPDEMCQPYEKTESKPKSNRSKRKKHAVKKPAQHK
ncbi:hypothetical protein OESDEN_05142 [Oesophagostomum dentatum]|uniref:SKA complex subunit 1 n=1 Tax=Oesophagostomum dentatum TaxID=61180 RepID=A0A0B1TFM6_OESDE|nr:hypothetical protein OESDEN_05142 [Oesophagostomum dentatum]